MIGSLSEFVNNTAAVVSRLSGFHLVVRSLLMNLGLLLVVGLQLADPSIASAGLAWFAGLCLVGQAFWPRSIFLGLSLTAIALWVLRAPHSLYVVLGLVLVLWLAHRLTCWAATGPAHARANSEMVAALGRDAAVEGLSTVALIALVGAGWWLAGVLPASGAWTWLLLATALVIAFTVTEAKRP